MHDDLKQRLSEEVVADMGTRPRRDLSDVLTRGRRKRLALRLVTTMSMVVVGTALVAGGLSIGRGLSSDEALPPANPDSDATVIDFPSLTTTFVSPRNGFSVKYPAGAALIPAKQAWDLAAETGDAEANQDSKQVDDGFDVVETGSAAVFKGSSTGIDFGGEGSTDERIDEFLSDEYHYVGGCGVPRSQQAEITIDGQPGRISECPNRIEATVVFGGKLYLFTLEHDLGDARAVFDAFAATIDLTPETAVEFPAMTTTFVSPTYGYSFKYHDRGGLAPATELWDPVNQPRFTDFDSERARAMAFVRYVDQFDTVETALGAFFSAASTEIPDGVSIDEWVDEYVITPAFPAGGCGVPRSQQAEITIDGHPGRIAECDHSEATVVAGGRLYLFVGPADDRGWFAGWVDTIDLTPETAAVP